jgi:hypothetical protein
MDQNGLIRTASADQARFDHRYVNGQVESLGLLVEEQRTNLLTYSNDFSNAAWTPVTATCVFTQNITGPDGISNSSWTIDDQSTAGDGAAFEQSLSITPSATTNYCLSIFVKQGTATYFDFYAFFIGNSTRGSSLRYTFSTDTLEVFSTDGGGITPTIYGKISYPNGWYRFYFVVNDANNGLNNTLLYRIYPAGRDANLIGTTLFYGSQIEQGYFPTSYIPTTTATVTRTADNASMTGSNFSSWYNSSEGTVCADTKLNGVQLERYDKLWAITNSNLNLEGISVYVAGPAGLPGYVSSITITNDATEQIEGTVDVSAVTTPRLKSAFAFKENNCASSYNGSLKFVDNTATLLSNPDRLLIGQPQRFQGHSCMTISQLSYYPKRLTNDQLQNLTK